MGDTAGAGAAVKPVRKPPLELDVEVETSTGDLYRLPSDSRIASRRPRIGAFRTQRGDGFATGSVAFARQIFREYADLGLLDTWRLVGRNGEIAYEGRLGAEPRGNDPRQEITANLVGWMTYLRGRKCGPLIIDRRIGGWGEPSMARQAQLLGVGYFWNVNLKPAWQEGSGALVFTFTQGLGGASTEVGEAWFYAGGEDIGKVIYDFDQMTGGASADLHDVAFLSKDDIISAGESGVNHNGADAVNQSVTATQAGRKYAGFQVAYTGAFTGDMLNAHAVRSPAVLGTHGLTLRGTWPDVGYWLSDIKRYVIQVYRPKITYRGDTNTYVVKQATWHDNRSDPYDIVCNQLADLDLWETNIWENREFWNHPADLTKYDWLIRTDDPGVRVMFDGPSIENTANGIEVTYTNYAGVKRTLNPADYPELRDESDTNPANRHGEELYTEDEVPWPCELAEALQFGRARLIEFIRPKRPATFRIAGGYIRDGARNWQQGWRVRNSQTLGVLDHPYDSPRLIYATSYDPATDNFDITVDGLPKRMDAIVARQQRAREAANLT